ncbi:unnamed protein product [Rangifer tarandus platyrhynchus]|uniref:Uncharacterized protein n=1 Tax=Rangifer tarandus platyrhynchus TaxID=3082113 RepID=A0AC59Y464_RANTA
MVTPACRSLCGLPGRALTPMDGPSPRLAVSTHSLCAASSFRLVSWGLTPPPPWMAAGLIVVTFCGMSPSSRALRGGRRLSQPTWQGLCHSVLGPTHLGGSFGQGRPPEGKQVGALTFPEGGLQQSAEESGRKGTSQTARPHRVKNLACA